MSAKHINIPIFVPHKGCPYNCIYCNQKLISGQLEEMDEKKMISTIEEHLNTIRKDSYVEIGFFGGSFTGIDRGKQISFLRIANRYIDRGLVDAIRLSTRPDYIDEEILNYLEYYRVKTIELGVQSLDEEVLSKSCRGHSSEEVVRASRLIKEKGFTLGIQTMIGLPGDTREKTMDTAYRVVQLQPAIVRIYPTLVIKGTYLEKLFYQSIYKPLDIEEAVEICTELLEIYENHQIKVIRMGLQTTENINEEKDVVAGPFHPAFRQLVESRRILKKMERIIFEEHLEVHGEIVIYASERNISNVVGQKKQNLAYLKQKFHYKNIYMKIQNNLEGAVKILGL